MLETPALRAGKRTLLRDVRASIGRESRVHLAGPNGAGKTTLLRALLETSRIEETRLLYLPQELDARRARALLDDARALEPETRGRHFLHRMPVPILERGPRSG